MDLIILFPIFDIEEGIVICFKFEQYSNDISPIDVTDDGIIIFSNDEQFDKK